MTAQLLISADLLDRLRTSKKHFARLVCAQPSGGPTVLIAKRIAGEPTVESDDYPGLAVATSIKSLAETRLACLFAEPPKESSPMRLNFNLPLGDERQRRRNTPDPQPYVRTTLESQQRVLIIGATGAEVLSARPSPVNPEQQLWYRGSVVVVPPRPTNSGLDPSVQHARIAVIGLGSIGSYLAAGLAAAGAGSLVLIDPDRLETKNLRRHLCGPEYVGELKVRAVSSVINSRGFDVQMGTLVSSLPREDSESIRKVLAACDLLVSSADSAAAQHYVNHLARKLNKPAVVASIKLFPQALGEIVVTQPHERGCLNCWRLSLRQQGLLVAAEGHDPADYPGFSDATPRGIPGVQLEQVASVAADLSGRAMAGTSPRVWLNAMQMEVAGFEDLAVQSPVIEAVVPQADCLVCGL